MKALRTLPAPRHAAAAARRLSHTLAHGADEVERKFAVTADAIAAARRLAARSATTCFTDRYFDTAAFALTTRDAWLRRRDAVWELKAPAPDLSASILLGVDHYTEFSTWPDISDAARRIAGVVLPVLLPADPRAANAALAACGVTEFAAIATTRERLTATVAEHAVRIDIDAVEFLDGASGAVRGRYVVGEVELAAAAGGVPPAAALAAVFDALGIESTTRIRGKVLEYLARFRPAHYVALEASGLVAAKLGAAGATGSAGSSSLA